MMAKYTLCEIRSLAYCPNKRYSHSIHIFFFSEHICVGVCFIIDIKYMIHEHFAEYHRAVCASAKTWTLASLSLSHILGKPSYATNWETSREKNCVCAMISNNHGTLWWNYWQLENLLQPDITGWKSLCLCNSDTTMELIDRVNTTFERQLENEDLAMEYWQCCRTLGEIQKNLNLYAK